MTTTTPPVQQFEHDPEYLEWRLTKQPPLNEYRRLDMSRLPPYRLACFKCKDQFVSSTRGLDKLRIWFKNVWNEETEKQRAADEAAAASARKININTQTKTRKMRRPFCKYCQHRGFPLKDCKTHYTKSGPEFGATITCPELLKQICARCGEKGHTPKYCKSEFWLKTDPLQIYPPAWHEFTFSLSESHNIKIWQRPIPPAFQAAFDKYQEEEVKTSRIWIEMTGDHTKYTNKYRLCMRFEPSNGHEYFDVRPRTEYESMVQCHYEWMRTIDFEPDEASE